MAFQRRMCRQRATLMASALLARVAHIGFGEVRHARHRPNTHRFAYANYFVWLPMRQARVAPSAFDTAIARNRWSSLSFYDVDHGDGSNDALAWLDELLSQNDISDCDGEVWLHTYPRVFGYAFKPVSFWYCHTTDGDLRAVVVEVNNTFGERHIYLLRDVQLGVTQDREKVFHVSPFCAVQGAYRFTFMWRPALAGNPPRVVARIDHTDTDWDAGPLLCTSVSGSLTPLNADSRRRALLRYPLMTWGVILRIHWQALQLWRKRIPFFRKPEPPADLVS